MNYVASYYIGSCVVIAYNGGVVHQTEREKHVNDNARAGVGNVSDEKSDW